MAPIKDIKLAKLGITMTIIPVIETSINRKTSLNRVVSCSKQTVEKSLKIFLKEIVLLFVFEWKLTSMVINCWTFGVMIFVTGNIMTGYVKNNEKQRHTLTMRAKSMPPSGSRFSVMISFVSGPKDRYPAIPNMIYIVVTKVRVLINSPLKVDLNWSGMDCSSERIIPAPWSRK